MLYTVRSGGLCPPMGAMSGTHGRPRAAAGRWRVVVGWGVAFSRSRWKGRLPPGQEQVVGGVGRWGRMAGRDNLRDGA